MTETDDSDGMNQNELDTLQLSEQKLRSDAAYEHDREKLLKTHEKHFAAYHNGVQLGIEFYAGVLRNNYQHLSDNEYEVYYIEPKGSEQTEPMAAQQLSFMGRIQRLFGRI